MLSKKRKAFDLSVDQKPNNPNEYERIVKAGGNIIGGLVGGKIGVARTFGDFEYKVIIIYFVNFKN